jgi:basic membrane protein A and related proteins
VARDGVDGRTAGAHDLAPWVRRRRLDPLDRVREGMPGRSIRRLVALAAAFALAAVACNNTNPAEQGSGSSSGASTGVRVALSFDIGGRGDLGFNDAAYKGMEDAVHDGLIRASDTTYLESNATGSDRDSNTATLADEGFDLVVCVGYAFSPGVNQLAKEYPKTDFAVVDGYAKDAANVTNLTFKENEGSYLVGAAAAMKTRTGTIGFLGGQEGTGLIEKFQAGYEAGARAIDPNINVLTEYIGDTSAAYDDITKGETLSAKMYDEGADVIYHAAGKSGLGLFKAAVEAHKLAIGVDSDQSLTASPDERPLILTSMIKRVDTSVFDTIKAVVNGSFVSGYQSFGLADDGVGYAVNRYNDTPQLLSDDIQAKLDALKAQITSGEITVPTTP